MTSLDALHVTITSDADFKALVAYKSALEMIVADHEENPWRHDGEFTHDIAAGILERYPTERV